MKRRVVSPVAALLLAGLAGTSGAPQPAMAAGLSIAPFTISMSALSSAGPVPYETTIFDADQAVSPRAAPMPGLGMLVMKPKSATSQGSRLQIKFVDLATPLRLACDVSGHLQFRIVAGFAKGTSYQSWPSSNSDPATGKNTFVYDMPDVPEPQDVGIVIYHDDPSAAQWALFSCTVTQRP